MNERVVVLDAGPSLNFCATSSQNLLLEVLKQVGHVVTPDVVHDEVTRKAKDEGRFGPARRIWNGLVDHGHIETLNSRGNDDQLARAVDRVCGVPLNQRLKRSKDLGETLVVAHAIVMRNDGLRVVVMVDDRWGQELAAREHFPVLTTEGVLIQAVRMGQIGTKVEMRDRYERMRRCDDGLVDITRTKLLARETWQARAAATAGR